MFMEPTFRWYGPGDSVPLSFLRQAGAEGIVSSLHHIPYGEVWSVEEIRKHQSLCRKAGMSWQVVESLPVHEDIKTGNGNVKKYIENYKISIRNLGKCGIKVITYNFMPVLDWVRTDLHYKLPDGSEALYFNKAQFAAFELFILQREGAENDYNDGIRAAAKNFYDAMTPAERETFARGIVDNFPGFKGVSVDDIRRLLAAYARLDRTGLVNNLKYFLNEVCPVAEEAGCMMTVHPDDPPYSILGLPRIVSDADDLKALQAMCKSPANGICFCSGSFSGRVDNDIVQMFKDNASRVGFLHLRSTAHVGNGNFYEADHLEGRVDMYELVKAVVEEQIRRRNEGRSDWRIPFRPDHGQVMMDDLAKPACANPGYTAIGRMRGLAEIRGLELGIMRSCFQEYL